jgi:hypothetical protein
MVVVLHGLRHLQEALAELPPFVRLVLLLRPVTRGKIVGLTR